MKRKLTMAAVLVVALGVSVAGAEPVPNDVAVTFSVCMSGQDPGGSVCVIGSAAEIGTWNTGVTMADMGNELWEVTVVFTAGTDNAVEYKYKRADCSDWEFTGNRAITLPVDGTTSVTLEPDSYNQTSPILCGLTEPLSQDVIICFQVCMEGVSQSGTNCVIGSTPELGEWNDSVAMGNLSNDLYQACITFPQGTLVPINVEYKFKKDDCETWEQVQGDPFLNHMVTLDNDSPPTMTITSPWEDGVSNCVVVSSGVQSWGTLKANFENE